MIFYLNACRDIYLKFIFSPIFNPDCNSCYFPIPYCLGPPPAPSFLPSPSLPILHVSPSFSFTPSFPYPFPPIILLSPFPLFSSAPFLPLPPLLLPHLLSPFPLPSPCRHSSFPLNSFHSFLLPLPINFYGESF